jgi:hypothetical protein
MEDGADGHVDASLTLPVTLVARESTLGDRAQLAT